MSRCTYDAAPGEEPRVGDVLRTKSGILHLVVACRQVRSRVCAHRFALELAPYSTPEGGTDGRRVLPFFWYPRGRRRRPDD